MAVPNYTDLLNTGLDNLVATLNTISGLKVTSDPRNINPPCALVGAPNFTAFNFNILDVYFPITVMAPGPGNLDAERWLLNAVAQIVSKNVAIKDGRPTSVDIGGVTLPAYEITARIQVQTQ
jgi:hypothetical protein